MGGVAVDASGCNNDELMGFIRARTKEVVREKGKAALAAKAHHLLGKPNVLSLDVGLEPDDYPAWVAAEAMKKAAKGAAVDGSGPAAAGLLLGADAVGDAVVTGAIEMASGSVPSPNLEAGKRTGEGVASPRAVKAAKLTKLAACASPDSRAALEDACEALYK